MTHRTQERGRGRFVSYTGYSYAFPLEYIRGLGLLSLSGGAGVTLEESWDLDRQMSHPGCLGVGTYRTQERRRGRFISYTSCIYS